MHIFETRKFKHEVNGIPLDIILHTEEEDIPLDQMYTDIDDNELDQIYDDIDRGDLCYFCARMVSIYNDLYLARDIIGCCLYKNIDDFIENSGYYEDMLDNVSIDGLKRLKEIKEDLNTLDI